MKGQFFFITLLFVGATGLLACGGTPVIPENGVRSDLPASGPEPGPLEETLRSHLETITQILLTPTDDPHQTVFSVGRQLEFNREEIESAVRQIVARIEAMTPPERAYYEERYAEYFTEATRRYFDALHAFRMSYPDAGSRVDAVMLIFD